MHSGAKQSKIRVMETRKLLCFMALAFSLVLLVQYIELPYGYVMSSLLSIGKSEVASSSSFSISGFSNVSDSSGVVFENVTKFLDGTKSEKSSADDSSSTSSGFPSESDSSGVIFTNVTKFLDGTKPEKSSADDSSISGFPNESDSSGVIFTNVTKDGTKSEKSSADDSSSSGFPNESDSSGVIFTNVTKFLDGTKSEKSSADDSAHEHSSTDFLEMNHSGNESEHVHDLPVSSYASVRNSSAESLQGPNAVPSSIVEYKGSNRSTDSTVQDPPLTVRNREKANLRHSQLSTEVNSSSIRRNPKRTRFKGAPSVVVPISKMNELLSQSRTSYHSPKPQWPSQADKELLDAKKLIESADSVEKNPRLDVYRNFSGFTRSYELMEKTLKIYVYSEGEKPIFHEPELNGIYASEGWFMKQLQESKHFVTKNGDKAHLFYLPFSSHVLQEVLYVPDSHSRKNLVRYLASYVKNITTAHRFWDRTNGADHFLVACHDWAPAETGRIMSNCIRALCNANAKGGFDFGKDVSLPETYVRNATTPLKSLGGKPPSQRNILAFFAGKMHGYLRPILLDYWENKDPDIKIFGKLEKSKNQMTYSQYMKSSKYCISAKGYEPYTPRVVEAIFYECVPVILSDNYIPPFFETLNWESFAVFVLEKDIPNLKKILESIPEKRYVEMQKRVKMVQKHFLWHEKALKFDVFHMTLHSLWYTRLLQLGS